MHLENSEKNNINLKLPHTYCMMSSHYKQIRQLRKNVFQSKIDFYKHDLTLSSFITKTTTAA